MWGRNASFVPPPEMVGEFKVQTFKFDAGVGRSAGGSINVALKSGTNPLHGSLSEYHNNNKLQGMDFFQRRTLYDPSTGPPDEAKTQVRRRRSIVINRFGATSGGPVLLPQRLRRPQPHLLDLRLRGPGAPRHRARQLLSDRPDGWRSARAISPACWRSARSYQVYDPATTAPAGSGRFSRAAASPATSFPPAASTRSRRNFLK